MKRIAILLAVAALMACFASWVSAAAQTAPHRPVKPKSAPGHIVPMRHDQLTLYPHGRPARRQPAYSYTRHRFDQPTPIHNTFMGAQYRGW
jgi:Spy/CpxP family protein refolding chaperone